MTHPEHLEAVSDEVRPLLWYVADITGNAGLENATISEHSTVANLISQDLDGRILRDLNQKLGIPVKYTDKLVHVYRRYKAACLAAR